MPPPPQPPPRPRPRKGRVLHAQSAFRTYICSNLNLCTLPMSLSHKKTTTIFPMCYWKKKKKNYRRTKKEAAAATKRKEKAKFAGHHQIPILFASTFIIVMIFISSSHHRLKSQVLLQQQKEKKQAKYLTTVTITNKLASLRLCGLLRLVSQQSRRCCAAWEKLLVNYVKVARYDYYASAIYLSILALAPPS